MKTYHQPIFKKGNPMALKQQDLPNSIDPSIDLEQARAECLDMIKKPAYVSAGAAIVPIPFFDLVVDVGVLSVLLPKINEKFGLSNAQLSVYNARTGKVDWSAVSKRATELSGFVLTRTAVRAGMNGIVTKFVSKQVSKFIPLGGSIVAGSLGYLIMKKVAESHIEECYTAAKRIRAAQKQQQAMPAVSEPVKTTESQNSTTLNTDTTNENKTDNNNAN